MKSRPSGETGSATGQSRGGVVLLGVSATFGLAIFYFWPVLSLGYAPVDFWRYIEPQSVFGPHSVGFRVLTSLPLAAWNSPLVGWVRVFQLAGIALNFGTLYLLVLGITRSWLTALFAVVSGLCAAQFHLVSDPFLSNLLVRPYAAELVLLALTIYAWGHTSKFRKPAAFATVLLLLLAVPTEIGAGDGHFLPASWLSKFLLAIPLVYRATAGIIQDHLSKTDRDASFDHVPAVGLQGWFVAFVVAGIVFFYLSKPIQPRIPWRCIIFGTLVWVFGAVFGETYLEIFGFGLVSAGLAPLILERSPILVRLGPALLTAGAFFIIYGNLRANQVIIAKSVLPWEAFVTVQRGAKRGLFSDLPAQAHLVLSSSSNLRSYAPSSAEQAHLFFDLSGKRFQTAGGSDTWILGESTVRALEPRRVYLWRAASLRNPITVNRAKLYFEFIDQGQVDTFLSQFAQSVPGLKTRVIERDDTHMLFDVARTCGGVQPEALLAAEVPSHEWSFGFYPHVSWPPSRFQGAAALFARDQYVPDPPWRYARGSSYLTFVATGCPTDYARVTMHFYSMSPGVVQVRGPSFLQRVAVDEGGSSASFNIRFPAGRNEVPIHISTTAPVVPIDLSYPRSEGVPLTDIHLLVAIDDVEPLASSVKTP